MRLILARLISEINPKINLRDLVGLILVMMPPGLELSIKIMIVKDMKIMLFTKVIELMMTRKF